MFKKSKRKTAYQIQVESGGLFTGVVDDVAQSIFSEDIVEVRLYTHDDIQITAHISKKGQAAKLLTMLSIGDTITVSGYVRMASSTEGYVHDAAIVGADNA